MRRLLFAFAFFWAFPALADPPIPEPQGTTITSTNTFQQVFAAQSNRQYCAIQNTGTHTMWVFFGAKADATEAASFQLSPSQVLYCAGPGAPNGANVNNLAVQITGTSGDTFVYYQL